ncbi:MAG: formate dehydrogenase accessory sulfurtransferase FdhD [Saprospiraceae bacterium]|nr:formate dehydrogenase accessory sulfurtransferase FdhD [Saprospiraceae bacterium]
MNHEPHLKHIKILKSKETHQIVDDVVSVEEPLEMVLKYYKHEKQVVNTLSITMRTPGQDEELVLGYLHNEGILQHPIEDVSQLEFRFDCHGECIEQQTIVIHIKKGILPHTEHMSRTGYSNSSCGICGKASIDLLMNQCVYLLRNEQAVIPIQTLYALPEKLRQVQASFNQTGGIHCCALFDSSGHLELWAEDVGRHNAMDKLCGMLLKNNRIPLGDHIIVLSGRASFELIYKACMIGCPVIASIGAPSSLAIETANAYGMTLIGFLKSDQANIYTHPQRVSEFSKIKI